MTTINSLTISYPDFKLNDVIDPDQFDTNNSQIVGKINEVITEVNSVSSSITGKANLNGAVFSGAITAPTITASSTLMLGSTNIGDIYADWTAWTPTITGWTAGNATIQAYYKKIGKLVHIEARFQVGSTTTVATAASSNTLVFSLPVQAKRVWGQTGFARVFCGSSIYNGICSISSNNTTVKLFVDRTQVTVPSGGGTIVTYPSHTNLCVGVPEPWNSANGDYIVFSLTYECV